MNDKYKEIGAGLAVIGSIVDRNSFRPWGNFWRRSQGLVLVVSVIALIAATARFVHYDGVVGAGADPIGTGPRGTYDALRKSLAAHQDARDGYARRLKAFLVMVDAFFGDADMAKQRRRSAVQAAIPSDRGQSSGRRTAWR
jgi:hypothetical protein